MNVLYKVYLIFMRIRVNVKKLLLQGTKIFVKLKIENIKR